MNKHLKRTIIALSLLFLLTALIYISNITNLPENVILFEGEALDLKTLLGINIETEYSSNPNIEKIEEGKTITVSADAKETSHTGNLNLKVSLLGVKVKEINVDIIENVEVVPLGTLIGVKLYTNGVLVVGMSEITGKDMERYKPYEGSGIAKGDIIVEVDNKAVTCTNDLTGCINNAKENEMQIKVLRDGKEENTKLRAVKMADNTYKIGLWVRDTSAGVRNC
ncbi:MAG: PDZ domain-containing protein [Clostridia bacterium]|jgi:stage IV sporulation protein B|nr:PDZ domain-containing protein [Clostridia bacterium]